MHRWKTGSFFFLVLVSVAFSSRSQTSQDLEKYWNFRERFTKYFIVEGKDYGQSLPIGIRNYVPDGIPEAGLIHVGDFPNFLANYIGVLATEYKLLRENGENTETTLRELYHALWAINRLDDCESNYPWSSLKSSYVPNPENLDGRLIRGDVYENFVQVYSSVLNQDLPIPAPDPGDPLPVHLLAQGSYLDTPIPESAEKHKMGIMCSKDHLASILFGLAFVRKCLDESVSHNQSAFQDGETSISKEAVNISKRIISYLHSCNYNLRNPEDKEIPQSWGGNAQDLAFGFVNAVDWIVNDKAFMVKHHLHPTVTTVGYWSWISFEPLSPLIEEWIFLKLLCVNDLLSGTLGSSLVTQNAIFGLCKLNEWEPFYCLSHAFLHDIPLLPHVEDACIRDLSSMPESGQYNSGTGLISAGWGTNHKYHSKTKENLIGESPFAGRYPALEWMLVFNLYSIKKGLAYYKLHHEFLVFPNPAAQKFELSFRSASEEKIEASLIDPSGRIVSDLEMNCHAGDNTFQFETSGISNGVYYLVIRGNGFSKTRRVVLIN